MTNKRDEKEEEVECILMTVCVLFAIGLPNKDTHKIN